MKCNSLILCSILLVACGTKTPAPDAETPRAPTSDPTDQELAVTATTTASLELALQGLMAVSEGEVDDGSGPRNVLWAWMVDTRDPNGADRPPCVTGTVDRHDYPLHVPVLYVDGGTVTDDAGDVLGNLIDLTDQDVVIDTGRSGFGAVDLTSLVSEGEFSTIGVDRKHALLEVKSGLGEHPPSNIAGPLIARVRIRGADSVEALFDTCGQGKKFTMAAGVDGCSEGDGNGGADFAHEVRVRQAVVDALVVHRWRPDGSSAGKLTITPTGATLRVSVRNVMEPYKSVHIDACPPGLEHLQAYRWFYALTHFTPPEGCSLVPCQVGGTSGGFKCPIPDPGGP